MFNTTMLLRFLFSSENSKCKHYSFTKIINMILFHFFLLHEKNKYLKADKLQIFKFLTHNFVSFLYSVLNIKF